MACLARTLPCPQHRLISARHVLRVVALNLSCGQEVAPTLKVPSLVSSAPGCADCAVPGALGGLAAWEPLPRTGSGWRTCLGPGQARRSASGRGEGGGRREERSFTYQHGQEKPRSGGRTESGREGEGLQVETRAAWTRQDNSW